MRTAANGVLLTVLLLILMSAPFLTEATAKRPVLRDDPSEVCAASVASSEENSDAALPQPIPESISFRPTTPVESEPVASESVTTVSPLSAASGTLVDRTSIRDSISSVQEYQDATFSGSRTSTNEQDLRYARWRPAAVYGEAQNNPRLLFEPQIQPTSSRRYGFLPLQGPNKSDRQVSYRGSNRQPMGKQKINGRQEVELKTGRASYLRPNVSTDLFYSSRK